MEDPRAEVVIAKKRDIDKFAGADETPVVPKQGMLIGIIWDKGVPPFDPAPSHIVLLGSNRTFTAQRGGTLWLTVNDIWLAGKDGRNAYTAGRGKDEMSREEKTFERLSENEYWNAWFDDNAGFFFVEIELVGS